MQTKKGVALMDFTSLELEPYWIGSFSHQSSFVRCSSSLHVPLLAKECSSDTSKFLFWKKRRCLNEKAQLVFVEGYVAAYVRFLKYTHTKQAFKSEDTKGQDVFQRSILGHILPEAMVCYLENYEPEKFSEIFLGEFDTPEAIWSSEMRRLMIEKIAAHLADFTPRLQSNTRALYQYCPIPVINYPQLEYELFCNIYYLKQLCDTLRFPDWPIKDPTQTSVCPAIKRDLKTSISNEQILRKFILKRPDDSPPSILPISLEPLLMTIRDECYTLGKESCVWSLQLSNPEVGRLGFWN
ncbi:Dnaj Subfamily C Member 13 [Manis pentadactyla]|nr:Dnaj Subfamily C Member 13 [Manis pentadactyla]